MTKHLQQSVRKQRKQKIENTLQTLPIGMIHKQQNIPSLSK